MAVVVIRLPHDSLPYVLRNLMISVFMTVDSIASADFYCVHCFFRPREAHQRDSIQVASCSFDSLTELGFFFSF